MISQDGGEGAQDVAIDVKDFVMLIERSKKTAGTAAAFREAFKVLDPDGDGELTREELKLGLDLVHHARTHQPRSSMRNLRLHSTSA
jgi:Ca2+-binding EF-hand superfamily protein